MSANAVIADYLALTGRASEAKQLFDSILKMEPDHVTALRGRINLEIRTGQAKAAIIDAQRLVSVAPQSARDRILLANAYAAAGDGRQLDRTLWNAFHEIPANFELYEALRAHVSSTQGPEAQQRVEAEFQQQRDVSLSRTFI
jgi:predicted Zn-dependent protease